MSAWGRAWIVTLGLGLGVWGAGCASVPRGDLPASVRVRVTEDGGSRVRHIPLDDYVLGVVLAELSAGREPEATLTRILAVQAVVARTYAIANLGRHREEGFDLCSTSHCQVYRDPGRRAMSGRHPAIRAIRETAGRLVLYRGGPIQALFHANCGGHTSAAVSIWGGQDRPYLAAERDEFCPTVNLAHWEWSVDAARLREALDRGAIQVDRRLEAFTILERDAAGRVTSLALGSEGPVVRGETLRHAVLQAFGPRSIQSTRFTVRLDQRTFVFAGSGFGHGVGLCQTGALARARAGQSPTEIIQAYYPGTAVGPFGGKAGRFADPPRVIPFPRPTVDR